MPELPEVETIARQIALRYLSARIEEVTVQPCIIFRNTTPEEFKGSLEGKTLYQVERYGKFMYWRVDDVYPVFHLGMSGIFINDRNSSLYPRHIHIGFRFSGGLQLFFQDVRKFSKIYLYRQIPDFANMGLDPTGENFTLNNLRKLLHLKKMILKTFLMDQHILAGIGNIYANEILFDAGLHPARKTQSLKEAEIKKLYNSIKKILDLATKRFGTTYSAYRTVEGANGGNQNFLKVYQRYGESCVKCGKPIERTVMNSRSTFFCKKCQK
jgi:formamidopyrimidine-DNA glycosylase